MRMNQEERRFDFHGLGAALKRAREEKGWAQAYVAELVDRDSRTIMNIENRVSIPASTFLLNSLPCLTFQLTSLFMRTEGQGQALAESTLMFF